MLFYVKYLFRLSVVALMMTFTPVHSASFDCKKATTQFEKMICSLPALNEADEAMGKVYLDTVKNFVYPEIIKYDQRNWLVTYRQCKETTKCIQVLTNRVNELKSYKSASVFSDFDDKFVVDGATAILRKEEDKIFVRIFGNWMPDAFMDPNKMRGFPHDGYICDSEGLIKNSGSLLTSEELPDIKFLVAGNTLTIKESYMCNARTSFDKGVLKKRQ